MSASTRRYSLSLVVRMPSSTRFLFAGIDPLIGRASLRMGDWKVIIGQANAKWGPNLHPNTTAAPALLSATKGEPISVDEEPKMMMLDGHLTNIGASPCPPESPCLYNITGTVGNRAPKFGCC